MYGMGVTGGSTTPTTSTVQPPPPPGIKEKIYTWVDLPPAGGTKKRRHFCRPFDWRLRIWLGFIAVEVEGREHHSFCQ